ncbi:VCBS repeat-containing protein [Muricauda sp. ANG21]|uniref:VCBS repeat-containing protein n=1 Tax=Allomuricauda sp. ANG21 TaxID=3042468 RepID=UPI0034545859
MALSVFYHCAEKDSSSSTQDPKIFSALTHTDTGIDFANHLTENDSLNYFTYSYLYMGGGVATGDINNDGLIDIYFTGNQVLNKLYLNKGNLQFEDITQTAGVAGDDRWYTGVAMADINGDGFLDIYCSVSGKFAPKNNQLFLNNGDGTFTEKAAEYGLDDPGNSVQATFFDYDKDGDLDLYVANYPPTPFSSPTFVYSYRMNNLEDIESDHLYRNDGDSFTNVSNEAGLRAFGLSLSATVGDLNNDSWPDLYVSNDFNSPDYMYLNNQDGTFREVVKEATSHTAFYGMGVDIADFNDDGNLDIFQVDMDAKTNRRKKANMASMNPKLFWDVVNAGFHYQYMHNCLQLNSGFYEDGVPHFSNVSRITGTSSTDWSWGPLFADFDNDGLKDLFVSNGTRREINNNDYFNKLEEMDNKADSLLQLSLQIPSEKIDNFIFQNKGDLKFERSNEKWGIEYKGFSNGCAYADLDNDGDLEIITNNLDDFASIFENTSAEKNAYIKVAFSGQQGNGFGLGTRVYVTAQDRTQMQELTLTRGFQSSVAPELHFGLGSVEKIDQLKVVWPDGKTQQLSEVDANQKLVFNYSEAITSKEEPGITPQLFQEDTTGFFPEYTHEENVNDDFAKQVLLPHKMSSFGPALAVGDVNGDGLDDYFVGGSKGKSGNLFIQSSNGFEASDSQFLEQDKGSEDNGALFFDADGDGDNDLYVVSGGYEFTPDATQLADRLYLNDGAGNFTKSDSSIIPTINISGSRAYNGDFNKDGKQDLLVLGRQVPGNYPSPTHSYILMNHSISNSIEFQLNQDMQPEAFDALGMATSAVLTDFNNDDWLDIIVVGEWMPIRVFKNTGSGFVEVSEEMGLNIDTTGWWWSIEQGDFDNDGDMDYVVGNNGLNYKYKASPEETFDIFVNDFDRDQNVDIVLSYYNEGKQYPLRGRECSSQQIPGIKKKFENYESFSEATLVDVYGEEKLESSLHYQVKSFASIYLENKDGKFVIHQLPREAQLSSINKILVNDYDKDGYLDCLIAGNLYASEVETPRNDAGHGLLLKGNGKGGFEPVKAAESGFFVNGDVKNMATIQVKDKKYILVAKNDDAMQYQRIN